MKKIVLNINGMSCSACSSYLEKHLNKHEKINSASVNLVLAQALIEYDESLSLSDLEAYVDESGYKSAGVYKEKEDDEKDNAKLGLIIFSVLAVLIMYISMAPIIGMPALAFLDMNEYPVNYTLALFALTIMFLAYGKDILKNGTKTLIKGHPNMNSLVTVGVLSSFIFSIYSSLMILKGNVSHVHNLYYESAAIIVFFVKLGNYIDLKSKKNSSKALKDLVQITPDKAYLKNKDGSIKEITIDDVKVGDILICRPGMKIAVDGKITSGTAHMDEAFITGESVPAKKTIGDKVVAGSINHDAYIEYKAEKIGKDSTISEIVRLVIEASNTKAPIAKMADKISSYFVTFIMLVALATLIIYLLIGKNFNFALIHFVTVLVVACPCALGLATPLAIVISEGRAAKQGILLKSSEILENSHKVDTIVFDKTGTLTHGKLNIAKVYNYSKYNDEDLLIKVASIENNSSHPIASAFTSYMETSKFEYLNVKNFKNLAGVGLNATIGKDEYYLGNAKVLSKLKINNEYKADEKKLSGSGNSIIYVVENKKIIALIGVKDIIRKDAKEVMDKLKSLGKELIILTGDNKETAKQIADSLGIDKIIAEVMPKDKVKFIDKLKAEGKLVMMVGDGINDAPSLVSASVGVSLSSGTDIANDAADVILMQDKLSSLINLIKVSERTLRIIKQNLFWAFFYNIVMIPIAIGFLRPLAIDMNPMIAALAMTISSLTVILNSQRLRKN